MTVYLDLLFLINFSMDYICLYICARVLKRRLPALKMVLSAMLGGAFSCASLFLPSSTFIELLLDLFVCFVMCAIVFYEKGRKKSSLFLCSFLYIGISMMSGGCMTAIFNLLNSLDLPLDKIGEDGISVYLFAALAIAAAIISLKSGEIISHHSSIGECKLTIELDGKKCEFLALVDSGNLVKDPISNKNVIFVDCEKLAQIVNIKILEDFSRGISIGDKSYKSMRLIQINSAGGVKLVTAFLPDNITIEVISDKSQKRQTYYSPDALIAPIDLGQNADGYDAIVPKAIMKI